MPLHYKRRKGHPTLTLHSHSVEAFAFFRIALPRAVFKLAASLRQQDVFETVYLAKCKAASTSGLLHYH